MVHTAKTKSRRRDDIPDESESLTLTHHDKFTVNLFLQHVLHLLLHPKVTDPKVNSWENHLPGS